MAPNHYRKLYRQAFPVILADCKEQTQSQALYPHYFPFIRLKSAPRKLRGRPAVRLRIAPVPPHPLNFTSPESWQRNHQFLEIELVWLSIIQGFIF
jgi:hypothetical protein